MDHRIGSVAQPHLPICLAEATMTEMHHAIHNKHSNKSEQRLAGGDAAFSGPASAS